jgi:hypothetical protein
MLQHVVSQKFTDVSGLLHPYYQGDDEGDYEDVLSEILRHVVSQKLTDVSEVLTAPIIRTTVAVSTSEMSVSFCEIKTQHSR